MKKITILLAMLFIATIGFSQTVIYTEDFESGGGDWIDQNRGDGDTAWAFDTMVVPGAVADFTTIAATFDDDAAGNDAQHDYRQLWHGPEDVSTFDNVTLTYDYALNVTGSNIELLHVSLWDNANSVWIDIATYGEDTDPTTDSIDVSAALLANPGISPNNLFFGFGYDDLTGSWGWGAGVDNIELTGVVVDPDTMFIHTATAANTSGHITTIDHPLLNGNPNAKIVVSHNWEQATTLNVNTEGVWYNGSQWTIYNEDTAVNMIVGTAFNVYIDGTNSNTFTQVATAANSGGIPSYTIIDDAAVNGDPNAIVVFGKYWNPNNVYNPDHYGVFYNGTNWVIFNEDGGATNPIPANAAFNVVLSPSQNSVVSFKHQATAANTTTYYTILDHPLVNGNPDAAIVFTHNWGVAGDVSNLLVNNTQSLWYDDSSGTWRIFNDDIANMNVNTLFNVLVMETPPVLSAQSNSIVAADFSIYPNPVEDVVTISMEENISKVAVFNMLGQEVKNVVPTNVSNELSLDLSELSKGVYLIKISANDNQYSKQFIKN